MNKNLKISAVVGFILYAIAAFFCISLLFVLFDFCGLETARFSALWRFGKLFTGVYGICSVLIPLFLLVAAFECFMRSWHVRNGVVLAGSVIPFFTLDAVEHICRMLIAENSGDVLVMKLLVALVTGAIIVVVEYLVLSMIGDIIENAGKKDKEIDFDENSDEFDEVEEFAQKDENSGLAAENFDAEKAIFDEKPDEIQKNPENKELEPEKEQNAEIGNSGFEIPKNLENEEKNEVEAGENLEKSEIEENPFEHIFDEQDENEAQKLKIEDSEKNEENSFEPVEEEIPVNDEDFDLPDLTDDFMSDSDETEISDSLNADFLENSEILETPEIAVSDEENYDELENQPFEDFDYSSEEKNEEEVEGEILSDENETEILDDVKDYFDAEIFDDDEDFAENKVAPEDGLELENEFEVQDGIEPETETEFVESETENLPVMPKIPETEENFENESAGFAENEPENEGENSDGDAGFEGDFDKDDDDGFGNDNLDCENGDDDLSSFVEQRNNSFASIFAKMDSDAKKAPMVAQKNPDFEIQPEQKNEELSQNAEKADDDDFDSTFSDFEFNPTAKPVVDSNGVPFEKKNAILREEPASPAKNSSALSARTSALAVAKAQPENAVESEKVQPEKPQPKLRIADYKIPVEGILQKYDNGEYWIVDDETKKKACDLAQTLAEFNIEVKVTGIRKGPVVTMFEILPAPGVNVNKIRSLQDNIALRLAATSVRIVSPIPGKSAVGIEIPNKNRAVVSFREIMEQKNPAFEKMAIPVILGKDISGEPRLIDLAKTPHLLIAGSTGSGKSVCVNSLILSILYKRNPNQVKLILIDPKVVELKLYNDIPHLLTPVITEPKKALQSLQYCLCEMERRYALLDNMGVRDISNFNRRIEERHLMQEKLPYIVVIIDEFADLMATTGRELESIVARLTAMSRAVGIHLVLATQRPSVNVITGLIKANIPSRIAFMVASRTDSNIIIDQIGAEKLLGKGDMLYASATDPFPVRIQGTLVSDDEVEKVVDYVKQYGEPDYIDDEIFVEDDEEENDGNLGLFGEGDDPLYDKALEIVVQSGKASASYLQRRLKIGYNRAARLVEEMEERGIVGPQNGSKPREVIYVP
ncbi:DNA translocase FtsK [Treponema berlinense]|uniref:DNA translocase FtsK n=1 Tax=Treponema berlinense TaxID=225004 RepID=UPI0023524418|nr:DNA translocase FtsK [Treponema berlinense]